LLRSTFIAIASKRHNWTGTRVLGAGRSIAGCLALLTMFGTPVLAQSSYGLNELLRDARKAVERGLNGADSTTQRRGPRTLRPPPLPLQNPRRAERSSDQDGDQPVHAEKADVAPPTTDPSITSEAEVSQPEDTATSVVEGIEDAEMAAMPDAPLPERNPVRTGAMKLPPPHPSEIEAPDWTEKQIAEAKARCKKLVTSETFAFEPLDPIREGICGTPAPIKLSSVQAGGKVKISPPATMTCELAAQLHRWLRDVVQPAAKSHLGAPIVRLRNVSAYSCRNVYNKADKRLSHHALANALDVAAFETATGEKVALIEHWNQMVAAKLPDAPQPEADGKSEGTVTAKDSAPRADAPISGVTSVDPTKMAPASGAREQTSKTPDGTVEGKKPEADKKATKGGEDANRPTGQGGHGCCAAKGAEGQAQGGKESTTNDGEVAQEAAPTPPPVPGPKRLFLRALHKGACGVFGTVLGPEANRAHRDHFHLDAKTRRRSFCE